MLSETATTDFFFTNDLRVLIDIVIRGLLDLEPEHPVRGNCACVCACLCLVVGLVPQSVRASSADAG